MLRRSTLAAIALLAISSIAVAFAEDLCSVQPHTPGSPCGSATSVSIRKLLGETTTPPPLQRPPSPRRSSCQSTCEDLPFGVRASFSYEPFTPYTWLEINVTKDSDDFIDTLRAAAIRRTKAIGGPGWQECRLINPLNLRFYTGNKVQVLEATRNGRGIRVTVDNNRITIPLGNVAAESPVALRVKISTAFPRDQFTDSLLMLLFNKTSTSSNTTDDTINDDGDDNETEPESEPFTFTYSIVGKDGFSSRKCTTSVAGKPRPGQEGLEGIYGGIYDPPCRPMMLADTCMNAFLRCGFDVWARPWQFPIFARNNYPACKACPNATFGGPEKPLLFFDGSKWCTTPEYYFRGGKWIQFSDVRFCCSARP